MPSPAQLPLDARVAAALPAQRLDRLRGWMEEERLDAVAVFGADNVTHLSGYARYYGGPSGLVIGRDGERTLAVMRDEVKVAERLSEAGSVLGYGIRGFGIELNPLPLLADVVASVPAVSGASRLGLTDGLGGVGSLLERRVSAGPVSAGGGVDRPRPPKDEDQLRKILHA